MCRKTPANIRMRKRCQHARTLQYKLTLAEEELQQCCMTTQLIALHLCLRHRLRRRQYCRFKILKISRLKILLLLAPFAAWLWCWMQQAIDYLPRRSVRRSSPSHGRDSRARRQYSAEEVPVPASSIIYCSQYRIEEYKQEKGPLPGNEKISEWLHNVETLGHWQRTCRQWRRR
jgi:hypothetical protein